MKTGKSGCLTVRMRYLVKADLPSVLRIEQDAFPAPWSEDDFVSRIKHHRSLEVVACNGGRIVGYAVLRKVSGSITIERIAVDRACQRRYVASQIVFNSILKIGGPHLRVVYAYVRESNLPAQLFFKSLGFRADGISRNHFLDDGEDAYIMKLRITKDLTNMAG